MYGHRDDDPSDWWPEPPDDSEYDDNMPSAVEDVVAEREPVVDDDSAAIYAAYEQLDELGHDFDVFFERFETITAQGCTVLQGEEALRALGNPAWLREALGFD